MMPQQHLSDQNILPTKVRFILDVWGYSCRVYYSIGIHITCLIVIMCFFTHTVWYCKIRSYGSVWPNHTSSILLLHAAYESMQLEPTKYRCRGAMLLTNEWVSGDRICGDSNRLIPIEIANIVQSQTRKGELDEYRVIHQYKGILD